MNSMVLASMTPKLNRILFLKSRFGVDFQGETWEHNKVLIEITYIAHAIVWVKLKGKGSYVETLVEWNMHKNLPPQKDI